MHKKYIKRGNKVFGPYYYTTYRDGDKVKTRYIKDPKINLQKSPNLLLVMATVFIVAFSLYAINYAHFENSRITGFSISDPEMIDEPLPSLQPVPEDTTQTASFSINEDPLDIQYAGCDPDVSCSTACNDLFISLSGTWAFDDALFGNSSCLKDTNTYLVGNDSLCDSFAGIGDGQCLLDLIESKGCPGYERKGGSVGSDDCSLGMTTSNINFSNEFFAGPPVSYCGFSFLENTVYKLNQSINSSGTCLNINANNVTIDCQWNMINYSYLSGGYGINITGVNNTKVINCNLSQTNSTMYSNAYGIYMDHANESVMQNISLNAPSGMQYIYGIKLVSSNGNIFESVNITTSYYNVEALSLISSSNNEFIDFHAYGINSRIEDESNDNQIIWGEFSNFYVYNSNGTYAYGAKFSDAGGTGNSGIQLHLAGNSIIESCNVSTGGSGNTGIKLGGSSNNSILSNDIESSNTGEGMLVTWNGGASTNNHISGNNITGYYSAIHLNSGASNNTAINNTFNCNGGFYESIYFEFGSSNNSFIDNTLSSTGPSNQKYIIATYDSLGNNITNTTFLDYNGSITFPENILIKNGTTISKINLNISHRKIFLNSSEIDYMNRSAEISLAGLSGMTDPRIMADWDDDGLMYEECSDCTNLSYESGVYVFNVSHFTTYEIQDYSPPSEDTNISYCPRTLNSSNTVYTVNQTINSSGICLIVEAENVTIKCDGNMIFGDGGGYGIHINGYNGTLIRNCRISEFSDGVHMTSSHGNLLINNTLNNNSNDGIYVNIGLNNEFWNNTLNRSINGFGIELRYAANNKVMKNNASFNHFSGIYAYQSPNNLISGNTVNNNSETLISNGIDLEYGSNNNTLSENTISGHTSTNNAGIFITESSENNTVYLNDVFSNYYGIRITSYIKNTNITDNDFFSNLNGVYLFYAGNTTVQNNNVSLNSYGINIEASANSTVIDNELSENSQYGIYLSSAFDNYIGINKIHTASYSGIYIASNSASNTFSFNNVSSYQRAIEIQGQENEFISNNFTADLAQGGYIIGSRNIFDGNFFQSTSSQAVYLSSSNNNNFTSNTLKSKDGNTNGVYSFGSSNNVWISNLINGSKGVELQSSSTNNTFENNNITGTNSNGIAMDGSSENHTLENNLIMSIGAYVLSIDSSGNEIINNTFIAISGGDLNVGSSSVNTLIDQTIAGYWINNAGLNIISTGIVNLSFLNNSMAESGDDLSKDIIFGLNFTFVNSSSKPGFNTSAEITFYGLSGFSSPAIMADLDDDGTYVECNSTTEPKCFNLTAFGSSVTFNVSHFTAYVVQESPSAGEDTNISYCPRTLNSSNTVYTLNQSINSTGTCLIVNASNVTIDCQGFEINHTESGSGIKIADFGGATIKNCRIVGNYLNLDNYGIHLYNSSNNNLNNNTVSNNYDGIHINASSDYNTISNNTADENTNSIYILSSSSNILIQNTANNTAVPGTKSIYLESSNNNSFINNTVNGDFDYGVYLMSFSNNNFITDNTLSNTGSNSGIYISGGSSNNILDSNTASNSPYAIILRPNANNNTLVSNVLNGGYLEMIQSNWAYLKDQLVGPYNILNPLGLIVENTSAGKITFLEIIGAVNGGSFYSDIRVENNSVFVNSSKPSFNISANITLHGLSFSNPRIMADYWNNGTFVECTSLMGCNNLSWNGSTMIFNVSHFTTYEIQETPLSEDTNISYCRYLNLDDTTYALNQSINSSGACLTVNATNVTIDCQGNMINYSQTSVGYGIDITGHNLTTIKNCIIVQENSTLGSGAYGLVLSDSHGSYLINNTIITSCLNARGFNLVDLNDVLIENNTVNTSNSIGIAAIRLNDSTIKNNIVSVNGTNVRGLNIISASNNNTYEGNAVYSFGDASSYAIYSTVALNSDKFINNHFESSGSGLYCFYAFSMKNATFVGNNFSSHPSTGFINSGTTNSGSNMTNTTFITDHGSAFFPNTFDIPSQMQIDWIDLNISLNNTYLNSSGLQYLNNSGEARITLTGLSAAIVSNPQIAVAYDDSTFVPCNSTMGCNILSNESTTVVFNVSHFTTYAVHEGPAAEDTIISYGPRTLSTENAVYTLNQSINCSGTCLTVNATNVTIDCGRNWINYSETDAGYGVNISGFNETTVKNCIISQSATSSDSVGVALLGSIEGNITNSTIINVDGIGISLSYSSNNSLENDNITNNNGFGITLSDECYENSIRDNNIIANGIDVAGAYLEGNSNNNTFAYNNLTGTYGAYLASDANNNSFIGQNITSSDAGIYVGWGSNENSFLENTISSAYPLFIISSSNNVFWETQIYATTSFIYSDGTSDGNIINNTLMISGYGTVKFIENQTIPSTVDVSTSSLSVAFNSTYLDSSNFGFLNTSAQIKLNGLSFSNPRAMVAFDDATFYPCSDYAGLCSDLIWDGSTAIFNVSHFTTYRVEETPVTDTTKPLWSDAYSDIITTYNGTASSFNINWTDNVAVSSAWIESNFSGDSKNYSMNNIGGDVYNFSAVIPAGYFFIRSWANDTSGNVNITGIGFLDISKGNSEVSLTLNNIRSDQTSYVNQTVDLNCSLIAPSSGILNLSNNGTKINSGYSPIGNRTNYTLTGIYNVTCTYGGNQNYSYSSETWFLNVSTAPSQYILSSCTTLSSSGLYILNQSISNPGRCLTVSASDITINCNGNAINFSSTSAGEGIYANGFDRLTVKNCRIYQTNMSLGTSRGIWFLSANNVSVQNSTILTGPDSETLAVHTSGGTNNFTGNNITAYYGIGVMVYEASGVTMTNNNVSIIESEGGYGGNAIYIIRSRNIIVNGGIVNVTPYLGSGIYIAQTNNSVIQNINLWSSNAVGASTVNIEINSNNNTIEGNTIIGGGGSSLDGIYIGSSDNNTIKTNAISGVASGITLDNGSDSNLLTDNSVYASIKMQSNSNRNVLLRNKIIGSGSGLQLTECNNSYIADTSLGENSEGVIMQLSNNNLFFNTSINSTMNYLNPTNVNYNNTFTNTTLINLIGDVNFPGSFLMIEDARWIDHILLTLGGSLKMDTGTRIYTGSQFGTGGYCPVNVDFLNTSARITFYNATGFNGSLFVDREDIGRGYDSCVPPECSNITFDGTRLSFNVSHFTTYSWRNNSDGSPYPLGFDGDFSTDSGATYKSPLIGLYDHGSMCLSAHHGSSAIYAAGLTSTGYECTNTPLLVKYDLNGTMILNTVLNSVGTGNNVFSMVKDSSDNLYFMGNNPKYIYKFNSSLKFQYAVPSNASTTAKLAINENDNYLYVLEDPPSSYPTIRILNLTDLSEIYSGFQIPNSSFDAGDLSYDSFNDLVYVVLNTEGEEAEAAIYKFDSDLVYLLGNTTYGAPGQYPTSYDMDVNPSTGEVYVAGTASTGTKSSHGMPRSVHVVKFNPSSSSMPYRFFADGGESHLDIGADGFVYVAAETLGVYRLNPDLTTYSCTNQSELLNTHGPASISAKSSSEVFLCGDNINFELFRVTKRDLSTPGCYSEPASQASTGGGGGGRRLVNVTVNCTESWVCSGWSECSNGNQERGCSDSNGCGTTISKPSLSQTCEMPVATPTKTPVKKSTPVVKQKSSIPVVASAITSILIILVALSFIFRGVMLERSLKRLLEDMELSLSLKNPGKFNESYQGVQKIYNDLPESKKGKYRDKIIEMYKRALSSQF